MPNNNCDQDLSLVGPASLRHVYKCVKNKMQTAKTLVFVYDGNKKKMKYYGRVKRYGKWHEFDAGYTSSTPGDSGSPIMVAMPNSEGDRQYTFLAVHSSSRNSTDGDALGTYSFVMTQPERQCSFYAATITEGILNWIKEKAGIK